MPFRWGLILRVNFILFIILLLSGCHSSKPLVIDQDKLPKHVAGSSDAQIVKMEEKLAANGVKIIIIGQMYLVSIPSHLIFHDQSPRIKWNSYALLNEVAEYLCKFRKVSLYVNAYNDCYLSEKRTKALTNARARKVANYLWSQNVRTRLLFTRGMGNDKPIVAHAKCSDVSPNSRIEIIFRRAIV